MGKKVKIVENLYTLLDWDDFVQQCEEEGEIPTDDRYYDEIEMYWDDLTELFKTKELQYRMVVVQGFVGRWNGTFELAPNYFDNITIAINKITDSGDVQSVVREGNKLIFKVSHHDGNNEFVVQFLSDIGERKYQTNYKVGLLNLENIYKLPKFYD